MNSEEDLKKMRAAIGLFMSECKSNSVFDFITWLDCKIEMKKQEALGARK